MNKKILSSLALCALLGACASVPPTEPRHVSAVAGAKVSDAAFARDDSSCKAKAKSVTDAEAAAGQGDLQSHFDQLYGDCMLNKGYDVEEVRRRHVFYGPYYGPGPYYDPFWGPPGAYYGVGFGFHRHYW
ncbi:hypothetical protein GGD83_001711 [Rhodoblastus sphagnicola]|nr:hypothetical protein [Rhodoblastus sphagnicola]MBB4197918.1 hypothetical protein [Rhodoblastus sphagnicola]